ncbi:N-acetyltransferase, partial [Lactobacillus helveticus]|nr:N-acetyltransferase [Lactobacillus helveticus]
MLESKRIYLRRFEEKDAEQLLKWGKNARYNNLAAFENYQNIDEARRGVQQYMA